jgi:hypothetical protein
VGWLDAGTGKGRDGAVFGREVVRMYVAMHRVVRDGYIYIRMQHTLRSRDRCVCASAVICGGPVYVVGKRAIGVEERRGERMRQREERKG